MERVLVLIDEWWQKKKGQDLVLLQIGKLSVENDRWQ